jgi:hypothetical protein
VNEGDVGDAIAAGEIAERYLRAGVPMFLGLILPFCETYFRTTYTLLSMLSTVFWRQRQSKALSGIRERPRSGRWLREILCFKNEPLNDGTRRQL